MTWTKDPDAELDYTVDWTNDLDPGDTIAASTWPDPESGIVIGSGSKLPSHTDTTTTIWLSGGTAGVEYNLTNRIVTLGGRTYDKEVSLRVDTAAFDVPDFGGCPWPLDPACLAETWDGFSDPVRLRATRLASAAMSRLTAGRVGNCPIKVRPDSQRSACGFPYLMPGYPVGIYGWQPRTVLDPRVLELPGPVNRVDEVMIDGSVIPPSDYRITDRTAGLIRYVGTDLTEWPRTQDWNAEPDGVGAFTVTYLNTAPVDSQGAHAAGLLALEFGKVCAHTGDKTLKCKFPSNITSIVRQGVSIEFVAGSFPNGLTGIREVDLYTAQWNIQGRGRATLIDPGAPAHQVVVR